VWKDQRRDVQGGKVCTSFGDLNDGANGALLQPDGKIVAIGFHPTTTRVGLILSSVGISLLLELVGGGCLAEITIPVALSLSPPN
jgi:hypothetical protein